MGNPARVGCPPVNPRSGRDSIRVAVGIGSMDRGDRPPELVEVLVLEIRDVGVRRRQVEQAKQARVLPRSRPCWAETVLAILFHPWGEPSTQNRAISVWSAVRVVLSTPPRLFTSLKSAAYFLLLTS